MQTSIPQQAQPIRIKRNRKTFQITFLVKSVHVDTPSEMEIKVQRFYSEPDAILCAALHAKNALIGFEHFC